METTDPILGSRPISDYERFCLWNMDDSFGDRCIEIGESFYVPFPSEEVFMQMQTEATKMATMMRQSLRQMDITRYQEWGTLSISNGLWDRLLFLAFMAKEWQNRGRSVHIHVKRISKKESIKAMYAGIYIAFESYCSDSSDKEYRHYYTRLTRDGEESDELTYRYCQWKESRR